MNKWGKNAEVSLGGKEWLSPWEREAVGVHKHNIQTKLRNTLRNQAKNCSSQKFKWERRSQKKKQSQDKQGQAETRSTLRPAEGKIRTWEEKGKGSQWCSEEAVRAGSPAVHKFPEHLLLQQQRFGHSLSAERSEVNNLESDCPQLATANYRDHSRQSLTYVPKFFFFSFLLSAYNNFTLFSDPP